MDRVAQRQYDAMEPRDEADECPDCGERLSEDDPVALDGDRKHFRCISWEYVVEVALDSNDHDKVAKAAWLIDELLGAAYRRRDDLARKLAAKAARVKAVGP